MLNQNSIQQSLRGLSLILATFSLVGCGFEQLIKIPVKSGPATVESYNTKLYQQSIENFDPVPLGYRVSALHLEPRVDHLFFLVDQSSALSNKYRGKETRLYAREMVHRFIRTMPDQSYSGALLIVDQQLAASKGPELHITNFTGDDIEPALNTSATTDQVAAPSLKAALERLALLLNRTHGRSAVILVSSWSQISLEVEEAVMRMRRGAVSKESKAAERHSDQSGVCFYTLGVGNRLSRTRLETVDSCGYSVAADKVAQPRDMAHFVQRVLYKGPADSDGDGIYDYRDRCPKTPADRIVDYSGCLRFAIEKGRS